MDQMITYPIGEASFTNLREDNAVYVDKTTLIYQLVKQWRYYFLSRPRRFGKSLLVSTLEAYFQGRRELFEGLAMEGLEKEWVKYPVLHVDFSGVNYSRKGKLEASLRDVLSSWEQVYCGEESDDIFEFRFKRVIMRAHAQTGRPVVKLGVSFSSKTRNIAECIVREEGKEDVRMAVLEGKLQAVGE